MSVGILPEFLINQIAAASFISLAFMGFAGIVDALFA